MNKNNIRKRNSKTLNLYTKKYILSPKKFDFGGLSESARNLGSITTMSPSQTKLAGLTPSSNTLNTGKSNIPNNSNIGNELNILNGLGSISGGVTSILDSSMRNAQIADTSGIESEIENVGNASFADNSDYSSFLDSVSSFNYADTDYNWKDIRGASGWELAGNTINSIGSGAMAGLSVGGPWGAVAGAAVGLGGALTGLFVGNKKAKEKAAELNALAELANNRADASKMMQFDTLNNESYLNSLRTIAANGGKINIKKKNRGKFTASANRAGMGVQEFAKHVLSNKDKYSTTMIKRANFARNAAGWKHGEGGNLFVDIPDYQTHGGNFLNGITIINEGGTHEQNPYEGVPMGVAPDGQPNLVEEGEVIFNDYVFSNRLSLSDKELKEANLPKKYKGYTFALAAEDMSKESSERPNDPISERGLEDSMKKLAMLQEQQRMKKGKKGTQQMMAFGGRKYGKGSRLYRKTIGDLIGQINPNDIENIVEISPETIKGTSMSVPFMKVDKTGRAVNDTLKNPAYSYQKDIEMPGYTLDLNNTGNIYSTKRNKDLSTYLRYAPVVGSAIGSIANIFTKPDYENSDFLLDYADSLSYDPVRFRPINNYLTYRPLDRNYYLNQLKSQAGATRRAITNAGGNAGTVMASLLAADNNTQRAIGDTLMKMDMYNEQQRQAVEQFNRGTNQFNSQGLMSADSANLQARLAKDKLRLSAIDRAAQMREIADSSLEQSRSMNLTNFFDNLGGIGKENMAWNWRDALIDSGAFGAGADRFKSGGKLLTKRNRRRK